MFQWSKRTIYPVNVPAECIQSPLDILTSKVLRDSRFAVLVSASDAYLSDCGLRILRHTFRLAYSLSDCPHLVLDVCTLTSSFFLRLLQLVDPGIDLPQYKRFSVALFAVRVFHIINFALFVILECTINIVVDDEIIVIFIALACPLRWTFLQGSGLPLLGRGINGASILELVFELVP